MKILTNDRWSRYIDQLQHAKLEAYQLRKEIAIKNCEIIELQNELKKRVRKRDSRGRYTK